MDRGTDLTHKKFHTIDEEQKNTKLFRKKQDSYENIKVGITTGYCDITLILDILSTWIKKVKITISEKNFFIVFNHRLSEISYYTL